MSEVNNEIAELKKTIEEQQTLINTLHNNIDYLATSFGFDSHLPNAYFKRFICNLLHQRDLFITIKNETQAHLFWGTIYVLVKKEFIEGLPSNNDMFSFVEAWIDKKEYKLERTKGNVIPNYYNSRICRINGEYKRHKNAFYVIEEPNKTLVKP